MKDISIYIKESQNELSEVLKNISKNKEFIDLLQKREYEYTLQDPPTKNELINGLCDFVAYFIYTKYEKQYIYYNISNGANAHWVIYDPEDKLYKDGYDYKGKANWKDLKWYKNLDGSGKSGQEIEEMTPEVDIDV